MTRRRHDRSAIVTAVGAALTLGTAVIVGTAATHGNDPSHGFVQPPPVTSAPPSDGFARPDQQLTPGTIDRRLTQSYLCSHSTDERRKTTTRTKNAVYHAYSLPGIGERGYRSGAYEIDHRVPLWAGGEDVITNLWPEPNDHPPGAENSKDILERRLYTAVCRTKTVSLGEAQQAFLGDWVVAFHKYGKGA